jgi:hypothetical protein
MAHDLTVRFLGVRGSIATPAIRTTRELRANEGFTIGDIEINARDAERTASEAIRKAA